MTKDPSDSIKDFMSMFDPANMNKMFDPKALMEQFGLKPGDFDPQETMRKAQGSLEAMSQAGEAAAAAYKDLMQKQMQIFQEVTAEAVANLQSGTTEGHAEAYEKAVRRALAIMTELSQAAMKANTEAYEAVKSQVEQAIKDFHS